MALAIEELLLWTVDEVKAQVELLASSKSLTFTFLLDDGMWVSQLLKPSGEVEWDDASVDARLVLLNTYGYLWDTGPVQNSVWSRKGELSIPVVTKRAREFLEDTPDLDPAEIQKIIKNV